MSGRYIDADDLSRRMYHEAFDTDTDMQRWDSGCWIRFKLFEEILKKQPTADVRENVHGEWIKYGDKYKCSKCFATMQVNPINPQLKDRFCYFCGAYMRKGETNGFNSEK